MSEPRSVPELTPELARAIRARQEKAARLRRRIAVVGMSCRFPAGASVAEFQRSLLAGRDAVTSGPPHARGSASGAALAGYLERVDRLDAGFFRISPAEAEVMDPQQRLLLEVSWEALEDAGLDPGKERRGAVYVGIGSGDYQALLEGVRPSVHTLTGTSFAAASGRIAFTLGWTGPALAVDTACSSSLVAIHQAMAALQRREADLALAGGVNVILKPGLAPVFQEAGMLAPDGRCKTFDAAADGFGRGEGCGMLVLKRLADAEREGDRILGVLLGSALNQDGASAGLTVPNGLAQEQVIREALRRAGVPPASVDYLEAHGTGTSLGDPIEAQAAGAVYGEGREPGRPLLIGSVKTNIGHLEAAAGVAGVIKVLLALRAGVIPKHLHCETPSPRIAWDSLPLAVTTEETPWPEITDRPRRAAVSSFALSGTNAHVVLEQYPSQQGPSVLIAAQPGAPAPGLESGRAPPAGAAPLTERPRRVLPLSARSGKALGELAARYREWLPRESGKKAVERLADAAWTAGVGRSHFPVRAGLAFGGANELSEQLLALENRAESIAATPAGGGVAFLYTGQGSQWAGMGRDLYGTEPLFREILDRCEAAFMEERGTGLLPVMFGEAPGLERTEWTQPALFALSAALTELWRAVGVVPDAVLGHSVGEVGAAWAAGAIGLEEGLRFAARRGALMGSLSAGGAMTAVFGDPDRVGGAGVALAAENGTHVVLSGPEDQIALMEKRAGGLGIRTERLRTSHAFHSPLMDPILGELESAAGELGWNTPQAAFVSGVTGGVLEGGGSADARYWRRQAREPVRFASGVRALAERGADVLIEIGPRPVLGPLAALAWPASEPGAFPSVLAGPGPERDFPEAVSAAYEAGLRIAFEGLHAGERRRRVSLPTYPFQRERYWVRPRRRVSDWTAAPGAAAVLGSRWELGSGEVAFESELGSPLPDWITRHRLFGRIVAPASLYAVQAAASLATPGRRAGEAESVEVDSVRIERPLVLSDDEEGGRQVQFLLGVERGASARSWEVFSRGSEDGPWVRHATGRVRRASREEGRRDLVDVARLSADLSPAVPEGGLDRLWTGADEAVGEVAALSAHEEDGGLHAALFSACLATAAGFPGLELSSAESVWLPVGWDLLWFVREPPDRVFCHARRLAAAADGAERVDFTLCDPDGLVLGALRGLALRRTPRSVLLRVLDDVEDLFYEVVWREAPEAGGAGPVSADFLRGPAGVSLEAPSGDSVFAAEGLAGAAREARDEGLEKLARATALRAFAELGGEPRGDEPFETARRRLKVVAPHAGVMRRMLALARPGGAAPEDPDELADRLLARCPAASVEIGLLRRCGEALSEVLRGRADPLDLLFGGTPSAADLYREAPVSRALSRLVGEAVAAAARTLPAGRRLRILEVGAGTGGTTAAVLAAVPQGQTDYLFTDVSTAFFRDAEKRFAASAAAAGVGLEFRTLDIERDPGPQGLAAHGYDIVIAANVLHATEDLAASLAWCRRLLAPSGLLVALEALAPRGWLDLTFGLLTGWWRFADSYRQGHPLVGASVWRRALADAGYQDVATLGSEEAATHTGSAVILGRGPAETSPEAGLWVVTSGDRGPGAELVRALEARGQRVATPPPTGEIVGREGWRQRFADLPAGELTGVVHLGALSVPCASEAGEDREEDPAADLDRLGSSALSLVQGMFDAGVAPRSGLWFVTRGGQVVDDESSEGLSGAALWGFGRAVSRELTGFGTQLLDLDPNEPVSVGRLADELLYPDGETQLALRAGRRLVPRLTPGVRPGGRSGGSPRGDRAYLVTGGLGRLGLQVAGWLAREGAGAIVLNGRRPPGDRAAGVIDGLRAGGAEVRVELGDIADPEAAARIVACIGSEGSGLPPFGGVFHCAGVLRDAALVGEDWPRFAEVLRPKLAGAWNLHRATARLDLDRFVLFSSVMGVVGNAGQSAYAAANATLDQLALRRRAAGLAGQSIAWGLWSDVGEDARDRERVQRRVEAIGMGWIRPELGLRAFGRLMAEDAPHVVVAPVDWTVFRGAVDAPQPFLKEVAPSGADRPGAPAPVRPDLLARLRDEPPARRPKIMLHFVQQEVRAVLRLRSNPSPDVGFFDLGMDSLMAVELRNRLNQAFAGVSVVPNTVVFDYPTPASLGRRLLEELGELPAPAALPAPRIAASAVEERIAVVGLACRFPGGPDAGGFWAQLAAGGEAVTRGRPGPLVPGDEPGGAAPFGGYVTGLDRFDAEFFRIAPVEAESLDPQQRLLLEVSWEALEDAGFDPAGLKGSRSGVFVGISHSDYRGLLDVTPGDSVRSLYLATGTSLSAAIGRVAFVLGLTGPAIAVDTACSSSLVAIHQAVAALQRNEVELALSGGVNAILVPGFTQVLEDAQMLSPDGRCRTFDARADGFVRGEGCGMVVLKRLSDAERDGDRVLGVLLGSAVNQDGASAGLTVPNGPSQERLIREALGRAGVRPSDVDYLEAHGTGTELGDPVEVRAAASVYGEGRDAEHPLLMGSVKTNVGHLEAAAGVAGLIKVLLAMRDGVIPEHLHFETPNPRIEWEKLPVRVTASATRWPERGRPRRAGVSSFGFSGTNAHVVVEGYSSNEAAEAAVRERRVLPLSGRSGAALSELAERYLGWLGEDGASREASELLDMAWTAGVGRSHFGVRAGVVFGSEEELRSGLRDVSSGVMREAVSGEPPKVAFLYTGQGSQRGGMGRDLYETEPVFREVLGRCEAVFREERGGSLLPVMFGEEEGVDRTEWTQPALFALSAGLTELWRSVGVVPSAVLGHSVGEIGAAWASGALGLEEGMRFAARRGALMGSLPAGGGMAAVFAPVVEVEVEVGKTNARAKGVGLSVAAENGTHVVVSGPRRLLRGLCERLARRGIRTEGLRTSHAFHSGLLDPVLAALEEAGSELSWSTPEIVLVSNVTGRPVGPGEEWDGGYWRRQARERVRFASGVDALAELGVGVLVEVGPGAVLGPLAALGWRSEGGEAPAVVTSVGRETGFVDAVGGAYEAGLAVSFEGLFAGERRRRVSLPTYPFQRERYWVKTPSAVRKAGHPLLGLRVDELLHEVRWREGPPVGAGSADCLRGPEEVAAGLGPVEAYLEREGLDRAGLEASGGELEREARSYALRAFEELGWERRPGSRFTSEELRHRLRVTGDYRRLFGRLLELLAEDGEVSRESADGWVDLGRSDGLVAGSDASSVELALLRRCGGSLAEVLRGRRDPLDLLFGEAPGAAEVYRESAVGRVMHRMVADAVAAVVGDLPKGRRLRVLEVGAGTGATTAAVLGALPEGTDYEFTDISAGFFGAASSRFRDTGRAVRYRTLDIEGDPAAQGFGRHGYDLVIAANVLHATRDLGESLGHCRELLAPWGMLVAVEATRALGWLDLTFGLLPGWWRFEDAVRREHALLGPEVWSRVLSEGGYGESALLGTETGQAVILARGPAEVAAERGLFVLSGGVGFTVAVREELTRRGQEVVVGPVAGDRAAWRSLFAGLPEDVPLRGVAHLAAVRGDSSGLTTDQLEREVEEVGSSALSLVQGMTDAGVRPFWGTWFVTRGGQVVERERSGTLSGSLLWGFGSVVDLEYGDLNARVLDLDPGSEPSAEELADELLFPDRETRVARRGGKRRVARLVRSAARVPAAGDALSRVRADRSYLVTGGLGGIGLRLAGWLAEAGAGAVVLNGRRAPDPDAATAIGELCERGVDVRVEIADVTDGQAVTAMLARMDAAGLPLGGLFHSVGVLADAAITNQDWGRFETVLAPKVVGAWRLHRAMLDRELDLFVLFSSVSGVLGNAGQANHAAANAFLDQLARHRRSLGLPGQAIAWGPWGEVGAAEAERERITDRIREGGEDWIAPERGLAALSRVVRDDPAATVALAMDWSRTSNRAAWLEELVAPGEVPVAAAPDDLPRRLRALPAPEREEELLRFLEGELAAVLRLPAAPAKDRGFFDLGMDSLSAVELRNRLNRAFGSACTVSNTAVLDHPDAGRLARYLAREFGGSELESRVGPDPVGAVEARPSEERVAIVGMACRFPGAPDVEAFRELLRSGGDAVSEGRPDRLFVDAEPAAAGSFGGYLKGLDRFDAAFFGIAPVEAELLDPQQRLLLEVSWAALEDAGVDPGSLRGSRTGVYGGFCGSEYYGLVSALRDDPATHLYRATGSAGSTAIGRVAFVLGLEGPALTVDTACSSSLVAIHQAAGALRQGEANLALAGGVNAILTGRASRIFSDAGMLAPDGRCKTFDARADGYVRGEGCGMVVLKRLSDAERDGDRVLGVLLGSAVNQDGASAGLTVPNGPSQERLIREALGRAGVRPSDVDYLEAHGTGTELGDPVEVRAAASVYGEGRDAEHPLLMGSVKTNVGHLEAAAGVAGLIKVLLAMRDGVIPEHLHFETPNPRIEWEKLPVRVTASATRWPERGRPRRAGVSSFGFSGTNAHVVVEGYSSNEAAEAAVRERRVLPLSGRSGAALSELAERYLGWLGEDGASREASELLDMAWTAGVGRSHFGVRAGVVFGSEEELRSGLRDVSSGVMREAVSGEPPKVAFLYTGQGSQRGGMGRDLYETEPVFREVLGRCEAVFREERGGSLLPVMFGEEEGVDRTEWTQPALFALSAGLTELWRSVGVVPSAVLGHSVGEIGAAWASGALGLEEGMRFAARRGALMGSLPAGGGMAAVFAPVVEVEVEVGKTNARAKGVGLSVAAENGTHVVVSGPRRLLRGLCERLARRGIRTEGLRTSHAFHSGLLDPVLAALEEAGSELSWSTPEIVLVSNVTGRPVGPGEEWDGGYWRRQARERVRFASGVDALAELGVGVLVEVGPGAVLGPLAALGWRSEGGEAPAVVTSVGRETGFVDAVGGAYEAGLAVSFEGLFAGERRRRVSLPTYPFQRERYWVRRPRRLSHGESPFPGSRRDSASGEVTFEIELAASDPVWLADHRVLGRVVVPGAFFGAQAASAVGIGSTAAGVRVDEVQMERPLVFPGTADGEEGRRLVQLVLGAAADAAPRSWTVYSRGPEEESWTRHAAGRVTRLAAPAQAAPADLEHLQDRSVAVEAAWVYERIASTGVALGPALQGLRRIWPGAEEALGEVVLPDGLDGAGSAVHPVLLDACFQTLVGITNFREKSAGFAWVPVGWDSLWLAEPAPGRLFCRVRAVDPGAPSPSIRRADLALYRPDGTPFGGVRGLRLRRATAASLFGAADGVEDLLYEVQWRDSGPEGRGGLRSADFLVTPTSDGGSGVPMRESDLLEPETLAALDRDLDELSRAYAAAALRELGWDGARPDPADLEALQRRLKVTAEQRGLFARLLMLAMAGEEAGAGAVTEPPEDLTTLAVRLAGGQPAGGVEFGLLRRCGDALPDVLRGRADGRELLLGNSPSPASLALEAPVSRLANRRAAAVVAEAVSGLPEGRTLRALEIGTGNGGVPGALLEALPRGRTEYVWADASPDSFAAAEERFSAADARLRCRLLDIERDPGEQGFADHGADLVLALNGLHATQDLGQALAHCRRLLAPEGLLVVMERAVPRGWLDLTFGLLPGWWRFDDAYRTDHALVSPETWRRALADAGFAAVKMAPSGAAANGSARPAELIVGRAPDVPATRPGLWVVWPPDDGSGEPGLEWVLEDASQRVLRPTGVQAYRRQSWREFFASLDTDLPLRGVVHLAGIATSPSADPAPEAERLGSSALALVQGLLDVGAAPTTGVWLVTRGGQTIGSEQSGGIGGSLLWGFGRTAAREIGGTPVRLLDLDPEQSVSAAVLGAELLHSDDETEIAHRAGRRLVSRLTRLRPGADPSLAPRDQPRAARVRGDRSYLVTGGTRGIGLRMARWLLDEGAGAVVLNGRRAPEGPAGQEIERLREGGAEVRVQLADVADPEAVTCLVGGIGPASGIPPLGGVVHSAGVLSDAALAYQDWPGFERVLRPKVMGAWNLHRATLGSAPDLFVVFSSVAGLLGSPGQANYAAANAFLDQLARHRRALGLAGQAIQWGAWSDVGVAADRRERLADRLAAAGVEWITPDQGLRALGRLVRDDVVSAAVTAVDWGTFGASVESCPRLFSELVEDVRRGPEQAAADSLAARVRDASPAQREGVLLELVRGMAASVLRLPQPPPPQVGFFDLGMDSLMAVELRNRINRALVGAYVAPASVVFDHPTAERLARHLLDAVSADEAEAAPEPTGDLGGLLAEIRAELENGDG